MNTKKTDRVALAKESITITPSSGIITIANNNSFYCDGVSHISFDAVLTSQNDGGNGTAKIESHQSKHIFSFPLYGGESMYLNCHTRADGLIYTNSNMIAGTWHFEFSYVSD
jgi:hypothetical protein